MDVRLRNLIGDLMLQNLELRAQLEHAMIRIQELEKTDEVHPS